MGELIPLILRTALQVLAGVGIGHVLDKTVADKVPNYSPVSAELNPLIKTEFKPMKLVFTIVAFAIGGMIVAFTARKLHLRILK
jgi:hypothetical protein